MKVYHDPAKEKTMSEQIFTRDYQPDDVQALANIYFNTIHRVNIAHYTQEQVDAWAPQLSLETEGWAKKFSRTKPIVAVVGDAVVGFAEFELNGHIDCFYIHHDWIRKGVGTVLINEVFSRAKRQNTSRIFVEVSITAKPFFERQGFITLTEQTVLIRGVELINYKMEKKI